MWYCCAIITLSCPDRLIVKKTVVEKTKPPITRPSSFVLGSDSERDRDAKILKMILLNFSIFRLCVVKWRKLLQWSGSHRKSFGGLLPVSHTKQRNKNTITCPKQYVQFPISSARRWSDRHPDGTQTYGISPFKKQPFFFRSVAAISCLVSIQ